MGGLEPSGGLIGGAVVLPLPLWMAHPADTLGSPALPSPQASLCSTGLQLRSGEAGVPVGPVLVGVGLGRVAVGIEGLGKRRGRILSSLAFAVGISRPSVIGPGMMLGAGARDLGPGDGSATTHTGIPAASGRMIRRRLCGADPGGRISAGFDCGAWAPIPESAMLSPRIGGGAFLGLLGMIAHRDRAPRA